MRALLDTHTLLWWFVNDSRLSPRVRALVADEDNEILVSAASAWEIATKHRLGKLATASEVCSRFEELVAADGFSYLSISPRHGLRAGVYVQVHADPFDRMLAAQAEMENLVLLTRDPAFAAFPVRVLW